MPDPTPPNFDRAIAVIEEMRRQYDPKRTAAERAAREELVAKYPGQFVAYLDEWDGERLTRQVLAASRSLSEVHVALRARPDLDTIRRVLTVREIEDPANDGIWVSSALIDSIELAPEQEGDDGEPRLPG